MLTLGRSSRYQVSSSSGRSIRHAQLTAIHATETVVEAISGLTGPVFQKVFLKDLPPELLLRVFDLAHIHDCRALGLTCQAFHELSLTYVYLVSVPLGIYLISDGKGSPRCDASYCASIRTSSPNVQTSLTRSTKGTYVNSNPPCALDCSPTSGFFCLDLTF